MQTAGPCAHTGTDVEEERREKKKKKLREGSQECPNKTVKPQSTGVQTSKKQKLSSEVEKITST